MRRNRIIWFCLWVLSIVGISLKGGAVTYGFFTVLTLVPLVSLLYLLAVYMLFHIYQELENRYAAVNEPVRYRFALVNEYPLQFAGIRVRFFSEFSGITELDDSREYELKPNSRIELETNLICKYRGEYEVGICAIEIQDFFRLFRLKYKNKECIHAVVRPQLIQTELIGGNLLSDTVRESERSRSEPDILCREYVPGDDPRLIHWNQSARSGALMTRILNGSEHQEIAVVIDTFRSSDDPSAFLPAENKILETALAVAYYFTCRQISVAAYYLEQELVRQAVESTWKFEAFYDQLSAVGFSSLHTHQQLYASALRRQDLLGSAMLFLILSSWDAGIDALLRELSGSGMQVVVCFVGDDAAGCPELSGYKHCELIRIDPDGDLTKGLGA